MPRALPVLPALVAALSLSAALTARAEDKAPPRVVLKADTAAPWIAAFDLEGNPWSLHKSLAERGVKGAVVQFWAASCKPCLKELDLLVAGREKLEQAGIRVLLVNLLDPPERVQAIAAEHKLAGLKLIRDATGAVAEQVGATAPGQAAGDLKLPLTLVVANGIEKKLVKVYAGEINPNIVDDAIALLASVPARGR